MDIYIDTYKKLCTEYDATIAVFEALCSCEDGDTLHHGGGELHFRPDMAFTKEYYVSNNDYNLKPIEFPLIGKKNLTVDGDGCRMIFHGKMSPFVVDNCEKITLKNFTVDYAEPMYFEGKIINSGDDFVEMEYDENLFHCDILDHNFRFYGENWENVTDHVLSLEFDPSYKGPDAYASTYFASVSATPDTSFLSRLFRYLTASKPRSNRLRLVGNIGYRHKIGNTWLCTHNGRHYPGIFVTESRNVTVENHPQSHAVHGRHLPAERKYNSHGCDSRAVRGQNSVCGRGRNSFCQLQRHNPHERLPFREYDGRCLQHSRHIYARCQKAVLYPCSAPFRSFSTVWSEYFQKGR